MNTHEKMFMFMCSLLNIKPTNLEQGNDNNRTYKKYINSNELSMFYDDFLGQIHVSYDFYIKNQLSHTVYKNIQDPTEPEITITEFRCLI